MRYTIFNAPVIKTLVHAAASLALRVFGWKVAGTPPDAKKYVVAAEPHTTSWDFLFTMLILAKLRIDARTLAKQELFRWPMGWILPRLGLIPVDRQSSTGMVDRMVERFNARDEMVLILSPSGTRKRSRRWKTGFYYMAEGAGVPIVPGYLDYRRKVGGLGPAIYPTGDIDADMARLKRFYSKITAKYPAKRAKG